MQCPLFLFFLFTIMVRFNAGDVIPIVLSFCRAIFSNTEDTLKFPIFKSIMWCLTNPGSCKKGSWHHTPISSNKNSKASSMLLILPPFRKVIFSSSKLLYHKQMFSQTEKYKVDTYSFVSLSKCMTFTTNHSSFSSSDFTLAATWNGREWI